jgi:hypothetical protein
MRSSHRVRIIMVMRYTNVILGSSNNSDVTLVQMKGVRKMRIWKLKVIANWSLSVNLEVMGVLSGIAV